MRVEDRAVGLTDKDVLRGATEIAWFVFESPAYGLEAPVRVIDEAGATQAAVAIIDVLSYARIARVTQAESKSFAFVHRRFLEYLVTTRLLDQPEDLPVEHIPTDSRGRDALVLYAQLCDAASADKLAALCWSEIQAHFHDPPTRLRAIHCLRFLIDAFCSRRAAVAPFASELAEFIRLHVAQGENLVHAKICVEGTGLLSESDALPILKMAMAGNNSWLQETAFRACRHLPRLEPELEGSIASYVVAMSLRQFWANRRALIFSLSLSESLKGVHRTTVLRYRNLLMSAGAMPLSFAAAPLLGVLGLALYGEMYFLLFAFGGLDELAKGVLHKKKRMRFVETHPRMERYKRLLVTFEHILSLQSLRMVWGATFIIWGAGVVAAAHLFPSTDAFFRLGLFWNWYEGLVWTPALAMMLLGMMVLDWLIVRALWRNLLHELKRPDELLIVAGALTLVLLLFLYAFIPGFEWLVGLLRQWGLEWMLSMVPLLILGSFVALTFWRVGRASYRHFRDRSTSSRFAVSNRMPRADIATSLDSLFTNHWRLAFVRQLAQQKVMATGDWPAGFRLAVAADPALTELAKLEERWLKLDR